MSPFCANKLCRLHSVAAEPRMRVAKYIEANGREVEARRVTIRCAVELTTVYEWTFCEICANAIAMVNEAKT